VQAVRRLLLSGVMPLGLGAGWPTGICTAARTSSRRPAPVHRHWPDAVVSPGSVCIPNRRNPLPSRYRTGLLAGPSGRHPSAAARHLGRQDPSDQPRRPRHTPCVGQHASLNHQTAAPPVR